MSHNWTMFDKILVRYTVAYLCTVSCWQWYMEVAVGDVSTHLRSPESLLVRTAFSFLPKQPECTIERKPPKNAEICKFV
jgi:hypothetical protein